MVGDYGIRMAYQHSNGNGIAHYSFLRITSNGENSPIVFYMKPSIVDRQYLYQIVDDELFSQIIYPLNNYELQGAPSWLKIKDRVIYGIPSGYPST